MKLYHIWEYINIAVAEINVKYLPYLSILTGSVNIPFSRVYSHVIQCGLRHNICSTCECYFGLLKYVCESYTCRHS